MPHIQLTPPERKAHRAEAHHLDPVVMIGNDGLTAAIVVAVVVLSKTLRKKYVPEEEASDE